MPTVIIRTTPATPAQGARVAQIAARLIGAPFVHGARGGMKGLDCIGLALTAGAEAGAVSHMDGTSFTTHDTTAYPRGAGGGALRAALEMHLIPTPLNEAAEGDVLLFDIRGALRHVGVRGISLPHGSFRLIHAYEGAGGVREHTAGCWARMARGAFRFAFPYEP